MSTQPNKRPGRQQKQPAKRHESTSLHGSNRLARRPNATFTWNSTGNQVNATFDQGITVAGIPQWRDANNQRPVTVQRTGPNKIQLTYPTSVTGPLTVPFEDPAIRTRTAGYVQQGISTEESILLAIFNNTACNAGTGETKLYDYPYPAHAITLPGDVIRFTGNLSFSNPGRFRSYWADPAYPFRGIILADTATIGGPGLDGTFQLTITPEDAFNAIATARVTVNGVQVYSQTTTIRGIATRFTYDTDQHWILTGTAASDAAICTTHGLVELLQRGTDDLVIIHDSLNGPPGQPLAAHTPELGGPWIAEGAAAFQANPSGIGFTNVNVQGTDNVAHLDTGHTDIDISLDIFDITDECSGFLVQYADATHYRNYATRGSSNGTIWTQRSGAAYGPLAGPPGQDAQFSSRPTDTPPPSTFRAVKRGTDAIYFYRGEPMFRGGTYPWPGTRNVNDRISTLTGLVYDGTRDPLTPHTPDLRNLLVKRLRPVAPTTITRTCNDPMADAGPISLVARDPDIGETWRTTSSAGLMPPTFTVAAGKATLTAPGSDTVMMAGTYAMYSNVTVTVKIKITNPAASRCGLALRQGLIFQWDHVRISLRIGAQTIDIQSYVADVGTVVATGAATINNGQEYTLKAVAIGTTIDVFLDNLLIVTWNAAALNELSVWHGIQAGAIGECEWRDFQIETAA